jgi:glycosyltransferase involved in cell wall biosynthesis
MASGTPVVTSNVSSLPEVTGDAAVLVDPYDVGAIEAGMRRVLTDPQLADDMRRKGLLRAREFSWERSVAKTWQVYQEIGAPSHAAPVPTSAPAADDDEAHGHRAILP